MLYIWNLHNIVNHLYLNKKIQTHLPAFKTPLQDSSSVFTSNFIYIPCASARGKKFAFHNIRALSSSSSMLWSMEHRFPDQYGQLLKFFITSRPPSLGNVFWSLFWTSQGNWYLWHFPLFTVLLHILTYFLLKFIAPSLKA